MDAINRLELSPNESRLAKRKSHNVRRYFDSSPSMMKAIMSRCEARWIREHSLTHKTSLELLNAPSKDEHDIIETSLEIRTSSLHAHAPPQHLATQNGAAQVIT